MPAGDQEPQRSPLQKYLRYSHLGTQFFISVGLPIALGVWLDDRLNTTPLFILLGLVLGFSVGVYGLYRELFLKGQDSAGRRGKETQETRHEEQRKDHQRR